MPPDIMCCSALSRMLSVQFVYSDEESIRCAEKRILTSPNKKKTVA